MTSPQEYMPTKLVIFPEKQMPRGRTLSRIPEHLNIVEPFTATRSGLLRVLGRTDRPPVFRITGFESIEVDGTRLQRLGGSVLHHYRDQVVAAMTRERIKHQESVWEEDERFTVYSGTWQVATDRMSTVKTIFALQQHLDDPDWHVASIVDAYRPSEDFRQDIPYLEEKFRNRQQPA